MKRLIKKYKYYLSGVLFLLLIAYYFCLPSPLFESPTSTILTDKNEQLIAAMIADDGQWRFPENEKVPEKFKAAILEFEDKHFYSHPGINPVSLFRALWWNISAGEVVSGGSTITMQVIRLSRRQPRTIGEKIIEIIMATRLELAMSKDEILALYASHAPFGGNVVGLDAAAWRYFGRRPHDLSWGEAATLAVLPNSPSLIYPGKNEEKLKNKRNRLLDRLFVKGTIDSLTCALAKDEDLPRKPKALPQIAPHLLTRAINEKKTGQRVVTTLDIPLQRQTDAIVKRHHHKLKGNGIYNAAALVMDVHTGEVLAYIGNTDISLPYEHGGYVDVITAPRSTGSILKPFLYVSMLDEGQILPNTLVPDVPTIIGGYTPQNYNKTYDGAVPAKMALARSLNIPAVHLLRQYGVAHFHQRLQELGLQTIVYEPDHYGLSLILGGAEGSLWDITGVYASMARRLNQHNEHKGKYVKGDFHPPYYEADTVPKEIVYTKHVQPTAGAVWQTFQALLEVNRPQNQTGWEAFSSSQNIAWKTGTSYGLRDGWAVGVTKDYAVGVWVGNADGEGRPALTGVGCAAPILFDIFRLLKRSDWFKEPIGEFKKVRLCTKSGHKASEYCTETKTAKVLEKGLNTELCAYHQVIHLDETGKYRVHSDCESVSNMQHKNWFVLPPIQEWYYKNNNAFYEPLPPLREDCRGEIENVSMELFYPKKDSRIYIPMQMSGEASETIFKAAHRDPKTTIYWHIDNEYIGKTTQFHNLTLHPEEGKHVLTLVDETGEMLQQNFEVIGRPED